MKTAVAASWGVVAETRAAMARTNARMMNGREEADDVAVDN